MAEFNVGDRGRYKHEGLSAHYRESGEVMLPPDIRGHQILKTKDGHYRLVIPELYEKAPPEPPVLEPRWGRFHNSGDVGGFNRTRESALDAARVGGWKWIAKVTYSEVEWVGDE